MTAPTRLSPGILTDAAAMPLTHEPLPPEQIVEGTPTTASHVLDDSDGVEIGIWEMTPGTATDTEIDEVFIVLAGRATVVFAPDGAATDNPAPDTPAPDAAPPPAIELAPGAVVRLTSGMRTTWTVHETLRKVYLA